MFLVYLGHKGLKSERQGSKKEREFGKNTWKERKIDRN